MIEKRPQFTFPHLPNPPATATHRRSFGFETARPAFVAVLLFAFIRSPLDEALGFGRNVISRLFEYQADGFAVALGHGKDLKAALLKLQVSG